MKIAYFSDLHVEHSNIILNTQKADVVVLAGDIYALGPAYKRPLNVIEWADATFPDQPVLFVPGNHDFELSHMEQQLEAWKNSCVKTGNHVQCLWDDEAVFGNTRFLGTPLFTDFCSTNNQTLCMDWASSINDFRVTGYKSRVVVPQDYIDFFHQSCAYLNQELDNASHQDKTHVVVTHFAPSIRCQNPDFKRGVESAYWASDCESLVEKSNIWISGHTHFSFTTHIGNNPKKGHLMSNARGYSKIMGLSSDKNFRKDIILDVEKLLSKKPSKKHSSITKI